MYKEQIIIILRWLSFLPIAVVASWGSWFILKSTYSSFVTRNDGNLNSFINQVFIELMPQAIMGYVFIYIGVKVSPFHKKYIAYLLMALYLLLMGFSLYPSIMSLHYWGIWGAVVTVLGATVATLSITNESYSI